MPPKPQLPGFLQGMAVTARTAKETMFPDGLKKPIPQPSKGAATVQYPHVKEEPAARARGVISLQEDNCTSCMLCARECPDWCIYIEGHKTLAPPRREGGKPRSVNKLDRFDIDFSLCMYCGICVEVCPFEALSEATCYALVTGPGGRCRSFTNTANTCANTALATGLCSQFSYASFGAWLRAVGDQFCGNGP